MNEDKEGAFHSFLYTDNLWVQLGASAIIVTVVFCIAAFLQKESPKIVTPRR